MWEEGGRVGDKLGHRRLRNLFLCPRPLGKSAQGNAYLCLLLSDKPVSTFQPGSVMGTSLGSKMSTNCE